jgi:hypothetical protein
MSLSKSDIDGRNFAPPHGELNADYRVRIAREQAEAVEKRQQELLEQMSDRNSAEVRVRIWERVHAVQLPRATNHRLLQVVATQTGLTLDQVRDEQQRRVTPLAAG